MKKTRRDFISWMLAAPFAYGVAKPVEEKASQNILLNRFAVAGFQYYQGPKLIKSIGISEELILRAEPENCYDEFAVKIYFKSYKIGYVPASDNRHISRLLQQNIGLRCEVMEVDPEEVSWQMLKVGVFLVV